MHSFKVPSAEELDHDYLWRYARACRRAATSASSIARTTRRCWSSASTRRFSTGRSCPGRAQGRHLEAPLREINDWERYLTDNGLALVKLFLNLSKEEQRGGSCTRRPAGQELEVLGGRRQRAPVLGRLPGGLLGDAVATSTAWAPWYVIPQTVSGSRGCAAADRRHAHEDRPALSDGERRPAASPGPPPGAGGRGRGPEGAAPDPWEAEQRTADVVAEGGR